MFRKSSRSASNASTKGNNPGTVGGGGGTDLIFPNSIPVNDDVLEEEKSDTKPKDSTIPRTSTLKKLSKQLSKIPFQRKTLSKDQDGAEDKNKSSAKQDSEESKKEPLTSKKSLEINQEIMLEANGTLPRKTSVPTSGENTVDEDVAEYLRAFAMKQNEKIAELEEKLTEKESALILSQNLYTASLSQILTLKEKLSKEDDLNRKNESLQKKIAGLEGESSDLQSKLDKALGEFLKMQATMGSDHKAAADIEASINAIKSSKALIEIKMTDTKRQSVTVQNERTHNFQSIRGHFGDIPNSNSPKVEIDARLEEAQKSYLELRKEMDVAQQRIREVESANDILKAENLISNKKLTELEAILKSELQSSQKIRQEKIDLEREEKDVKQKLVAAENVITEKVAEINALLSENSKLKPEANLIRKDLQAALEEGEKARDAFKKEMKAVEQVSQDLRQQLTAADQAANEMKVARGILSSENSKLKTENAQLLKNVHEKEAALDALEMQNKNINKSQLEGELAEWKQKLQSADQSANEVKIARGLLSSENVSLKSDISQLKNSKIVADEAIEHLKKENTKLADQVDSLVSENKRRLIEETKPSHTMTVSGIERPYENESVEYYEKLTKNLMREKSIAEYALNTLKAQSSLKEKEMEQANKSLTELLLKSERELADSKAKTNHLLILNEELEQKLCQLEGTQHEPEDKLILLLAAVESRLNSAMIDIIICQENLENAHNDRDQKIRLLEDCKRKMTSLQEVNSRQTAEVQALKEELFSCKLNYKDEIEKLNSQIVELGGVASTSDIENFASMASMNSRESCSINEESQYVTTIEDRNLKIPKELGEARLVSLGMNVIEVLRTLTTRTSVGDVNQRLSRFWLDLRDIQTSLFEKHKLEKEGSSLSSIFPGDAPLKDVPQNSMATSPLNLLSTETSVSAFVSEAPRNSTVNSPHLIDEQSFLLDAPRNSIIMAETDHSTLVVEIKKKEQDISYLEGEVAKLMNIMERRDVMIKDLQLALQDLKIKQEPSEMVASLQSQLQESDRAIKALQSEKNSLADKNYVLLANSISGVSDSHESLEMAQKMGEIELRHALSSQKLKEQIKNLQAQVVNLESQLKAVGEISTTGTGKTSNEAKLEKLLMANKIELFNLKNQSKLAADLNEKEIATLNKEITVLTEKVTDRSASSTIMKVVDNSNDFPLMDAAEFSWSPSLIYRDFKHIILNHPIEEILRVERKHLHYYHLCYTMTVLAMISIALPMTFSLMNETDLPKAAKQFTQLFACLLAYLIIKRPRC